MKKQISMLVTLLAIIVSVFAFSYSEVHTNRSEVIKAYSLVDFDTTLPEYPKGALKVVPIKFNALTNDTINYVLWRAFDVTRDTSQGCNTYVQLFDKTAKQVWAINIPIPPPIVRQWVNDTIIDNYILSQLNLQKKL